MKKQVTLTALGLLTVVGGSWLVAQQSDPVRETRTTRETRELTTLGGLVTDDDVSETPRAQDPTNPAQVPMKARRPSAASSPRASARPRQEQDARAIEDLYRQEARNYAEGATAFEGFRAVAGSGGQQFVVPGMPIPGMPMRMNPEDAARMRAFQDAIRALREAENAEDKSAAREQVTKLVSEQLEVDLGNREKELAAIEQRAKELRKQLDERKTAKPELLKMLVMLIDNPQVGLGIPPEWMHMLMRGQPNQNRQGYPISGAFNYSMPDVPMQPARPAEVAEPAAHGEAH